MKSYTIQFEAAKEIDLVVEDYFVIVAAEAIDRPSINIECFVLEFKEENGTQRSVEDS